MSSVVLEDTSLVVEQGLGNIIGNFLRQMACRGEPTWQAIAYKFSTKTNGFGTVSNHSYLEPLRGILHANGEPKGSPKIVTFIKSGENYVCGEMYISGLGHLTVNAIDVAMVYSQGLRSVDANYNLLSKLAPTDIKDYLVVPSHSDAASVFTFTVSSEELGKETLKIKAEEGIIKKVLSSSLVCFENQLAQISKGGE